MPTSSKTKPDPTVKIRLISDQSKRPELREEVKINATPENLAKSILRQL